MLDLLIAEFKAIKAAVRTAHLAPSSGIIRALHKMSRAVQEVP